MNGRLSAWCFVVLAGVASNRCAGAEPMDGAVAPQVLIEWRFDEAGDLRGWVPGGHLADVAVREGALGGRATDWDPILLGPVFEIPARPTQWIEIRMRASQDGRAELFWTETLEGPFGGFSQGKTESFAVAAGDEFLDYRIAPFWHAAGKVVRLRFDPPSVERFEIASIRILDSPQPVSQAKSWDFREGGHGWTAWPSADQPAVDTGGLRMKTGVRESWLVSPPLEIPADDLSFLAIRMAVDAGQQGRVFCVNAKQTGRDTIEFPLTGRRPDAYLQPGYGIACTMAGPRCDAGRRTERRGGGRCADRIDRRVGRADRSARVAGGILRQHLGRATRRATFRGNRAVKEQRRTGRRRTDRDAQRAGGCRGAGRRFAASAHCEAGAINSRIDPLASACAAARPDPAEIVGSSGRDSGGQHAFAHRGNGFGRGHRTARGAATDYVPEPQPVRSDIDVGVYYFPGWHSWSRWQPIFGFPGRKPVLGWYDEANPECADWQIKWAVEHGVRFFMVDWYWDRGNRHLEHWLHQAYAKARYRSHLQWAIMWANHNAPGSHSKEDWRRVTQYWIDHYFPMEEYYRIDGRPAVFIWAPANIRNDVGGNQPATDLYAMSQQMAREAGYKGIYFVAMSSHESAAQCAQLLREGYEAFTSYHGFYLAAAQAAGNRFPFSRVVETGPEVWRAADQRASGLEYIPIVDTGWASEPWHGNQARVIHGRTPELFGQLCQQAAEYARQNGKRIVAVGPWNEWGEGSYIEPYAERGFGDLEQLRGAFCPPGDWPPSLVPADVGRGPYDLPPVPLRTAWVFSAEDDLQGWTPNGALRAEIADGALRGESVGNDPILQGPGFASRRIGIGGWSCG
jgi:hypothetical protein